MAQQKGGRLFPFFNTLKLLFLGIGLLVISAFTFQQSDIYHTAYFNPQKFDIQLYYKDSTGKKLSNFKQLNEYVSTQRKDLVFATNAGMFHRDLSPVGLFIADGQTINPLNTGDARGNFFLKPNGVFYITSNKKAVVCETSKFVPSDAINFATQSGPMLVIDGELHPAFINGSNNLNIRSGVGIMPNGNVVFVLSKQPVNFYDFATYFKNLGCKNALYLDGAISQTFEKGVNKLEECTGNFGVLIGVCAPK